MKQLYLLFLLITSLGIAQQNDLKRIGLQVDNDAFTMLLSDKYYSAGTFFHYDFFAKKFPFLKSEDGFLVQTTVGQKIFTPRYQNFTDIEGYDRPFAGWLFASVTGFKLEKNYIFGLGFEIGLTGEKSLARKTHMQYHKLVSTITETPTWYAQIPSELMFTVNMVYKHKIKNYLFSESKLNLGTKDSYFQQSLFLLFFDDFNSFHQLSSKPKNFSPYIAIKYEYLAYDALIEGSIWNDNAPLTRPIIHHLFLAESGVKFSLNKIRIGVSYHYMTKNSPLVHSHIYGSLKIDYIF